MFLLQHLGANVLLLVITISELTVIGSVTTPPTYLVHSCLGSSNDTANTNYKTSLIILMESLSSKSALNSFYNDTFNGIFGLYLCRGDVMSIMCQNCVKNSSQEIQIKCPSYKAAIIWYDQCMVSYSNSNFFGLEQTYPGFIMWNFYNNTSPDEPPTAFAMMYALVSKAPHTSMMYSVDESVGVGSQNGYGLAQCTRDISSGACSDCLGQLMDQIHQCCQGRRGWRILAPSCNLRYEEYLFFTQQLAPPPSVANPLPLPPPPPLPSSTGKGGTNKIMILLSIVSAITIVLALFGLYWYRSRARKRRSNHKTDILEHQTRTHHMAKEQEDSGEMDYFDFETINIATNGFSNGNKLGQGGFGPVYKGKLHDGMEIAVKRLLRNSGHGLEEFKTEVKLIVKLQHRNLVRLIGCCIEGNEYLLVYEYMANTSLDAFLFNAIKSKELDWDKRANIVRGIARGLLYLHEDSRLTIIHRDLKASNILLDHEMNAKISDFGTARIFGGNQIGASSTNRVVGTYGYMSPEYAMGGLFSTKSDVYSFGVLMLEIISGRRISGSDLPAHSQSLLSYAWQLWNAKKAQDLIDRNLISNCPVKEAVRWINIALLCVQEEPEDRPSMSKFVLMLEAQSTDLPKPSEPPLSFGSCTISDRSSSGVVGTGSLTSDPPLTMKKAFSSD